MGDRCEQGALFINNVWMMIAVCLITLIITVGHGNLEKVPPHVFISGISLVYIFIKCCRALYVMLLFKVGLRARDISLNQQT